MANVRSPTCTDALTICWMAPLRICRNRSAAADLWNLRFLGASGRYSVKQIQRLRDWARIAQTVAPSRRLAVTAAWRAWLGADAVLGRGKVRDAAMRVRLERTMQRTYNFSSRGSPNCRLDGRHHDCAQQRKT
jgi:hypothetical protein